MVYLTCAVIDLGGRGVIKTWTEVAARVCLYMLTSDLTSLVSPPFSHWLQVRKVGTVIIFFFDIMQRFTYSEKNRDDLLQYNGINFTSRKNGSSFR